MLSLTILLHSIKATTTAISSLKTAAALKDWLLRDRRDPLRRALDRDLPLKVLAVAYDDHVNVGRAVGLTREGVNVTVQ